MANTKQKAIVYDMPGMVEVDVCAHRKIAHGKRVRWRATTEAQAKVNQMRRRRYVTRIVNLNFDARSIMLELDYAPGVYTDSMDEAKRHIRNYIRRIKRLYEKQGAVLKYIYTTERGEESGRVHHHLIVSGGVSKEALLSAWKMSKRGYAQYLEYSENGYTDLGAYYAKRNEAFERCFTCSQNIERPEPLPEEDAMCRRISRVFTKKNCKDFYENNFTRAEMAALFPGYKLCDGWSCTYNPYDHSYYMHLRLLKSDAAVAPWATTVTYDRGSLGDGYPWDSLRPEESTYKREKYYYSAYEHTADNDEEE